MISVKVAEGRAGRLLIFRLKRGADLLSSIRAEAERAGVRAGFLMCIGGLSRARLGFYTGSGRYKALEIEGPLELVACVGNIALGPGGELIIHAHACVADGEGRAYGGHLLDGCLVDSTGELVIVELSGAEFRREVDEETGLKLLRAPDLTLLHEQKAK